MHSTCKKVIALALPIAVQNIFSTAVSSADVLMVGAVSQDALSAVSLAGQLLFVLNLILLGLTIGTGLMIAQYYGSGDHQALVRIQGMALRVGLLVSLGFAAAALFLPRLLMHIFTPDENLIGYGSIYLRLVGCSFVMMAASQVMETVMKAVMKVRISTVIGTSALLLNVLFNAILIFGLLGFPAMGVAGAALGTLLARLIELIWCLLVSAKESFVPVRLHELLHTENELRKDFWHYSLPVILNGLSWGSAFATYSVILGHLGSDLVAANAVASIARNFAMVGCNGLATGACIYLGAELGAKHMDQAKHDATRILYLTFLFALAGSLLILILRPVLTALAALTPDAEIFLHRMLFINAIYVITKAVNVMLSNGILPAGGDTRFGLICDTIDMWCYSVPLGFLAAFVLHLPPMVVYGLICSDELVKIPAYYARYKKGIWIRDITREDRT